MDSDYDEYADYGDSGKFNDYGEYIEYDEDDFGLKYECQECNHGFYSDDEVYICPECGSYDLDYYTGQELSTNDSY